MMIPTCLIVLAMATSAAVGAPEAQAPPPPAPAAPAPAAQAPATPAPAAQAPAAKPLAGELVNFKVGEESVVAYLVSPGAAAPRGGVVVIHEWWGLNDQIKRVGDRLAEAGYVAIVPDLYRGKVAGDSELAHELMRGLNEGRAVGIIEGAAAYLRGLPGGKGVNIATIGFCMGGGLSLMTALKGAGIQAAVMFYGRVETTDAAVTPLRVPLLGLFGAEDRGIPVDDVRKFESALQRERKDATIVVYPGAGHAFFNEERPSYVPDAAEKAWLATKQFLYRNLRARTLRQKGTGRGGGAP